MEIIVPAAGLSTRFPNLRPKYALTDYQGRIMLHSAIKPFLGKYKINVGILKEHDSLFGIKKILKHEFGKEINIVVLPEQTKGPADTVFQMLQKIKIKTQDIFIKDCDSFFEHEIIDGNYICVSSFTDNEIIRQAYAKSYIISNDQGVIQSIAEKKVISDLFCVGGYKFSNAKDFVRGYNSLSSTKSEIFVSNVIQYCLNNKQIFLANRVKKYTDVGTLQEWQKFNNRSVIFCDIDGTIIKAQKKGTYKNKPEILEKNVSHIQDLQKAGDQIIFVTSRHERDKADTLKMLNDCGFENPVLLMGLLNCKRILINDYNNVNPYPRALAINIKRDDDNIKDFLQ